MRVERLVAEHLGNWAFQMSTLGNTAKFVRENLGMTQRGTAERLGVSAVHLSNVERDVTPPSSSRIARLTEVFGVDVYVLHDCTDDVAEGQSGSPKVGRGSEAATGQYCQGGEMIGSSRGE